MHRYNLNLDKEIYERLRTVAKSEGRNPPDLVRDAINTYLKNDVAPLVGKWFHTYKDGKLDRQGYVLAEVSSGSFICQLFNWMDGAPSTQKIYAVTDMSDWVIFDSEETWVEAGNASFKRS